MTIRQYISSEKLTAEELLEKSRAHWSIDVQMHWRLDVGFNEDGYRIRREANRRKFSIGSPGRS